jgi:hypothetical protein
MRYGNIFIIVMLFCGAAVGRSPALSGPDPTELLSAPVAKSMPVKDVAVQATAGAIKPDNTDEKAKSVSAEAGVSAGAEVPSAGAGATEPADSRTDSLAKQLWQDRITSISEQGASSSKDQLEKLLTQLRTVEISRPKAGENSTEPVTLTTEKTTKATPAVSGEGKVGGAASKISDAKTVDLTLMLVGQVCKNPSTVENSLDMAELLYIKGYLGEAAVFYKETLNRQKFTPGQKPWVLYQVGNCLRQTDPVSAMTAYRQLITDFPDSPWAAPAKAQEKALDWLQKEKPRELLK